MSLSIYLGRRVRRLPHLLTRNTPFEPSKYPGATANRICTVTHLTLTSGCDTPTNFTYLNTHLDDKSDEQRKLAASMLLVRARYEAYATGRWC